MEVVDNLNALVRHMRTRVTDKLHKISRLSYLNESSRGSIIWSTRYIHQDETQATVFHTTYHTQTQWGMMFGI